MTCDEHQGMQGPGDSFTIDLTNDDDAAGTGGHRKTCKGDVRLGRMASKRPLPPSLIQQGEHEGHLQQNASMLKVLN